MKSLTRTLLRLVVFGIACGTLFASGQLLPDREVNLASGDIHPDVSNNANLKTIYSNLGSKTDAYDDTTGWPVQGPASGQLMQGIAMPFTPKADATVTQIQTAVSWTGSGTNGFNLVLAANNAASGQSGGQPGKTLHSWDLRNLPTFGTCCKLATAKYANGIKVKKGKRYWVVARTDSKSADTRDGWAFTWNDSTGIMSWYNPTFGGWNTERGAYVSAFAVQGK